MKTYKEERPWGNFEQFCLNQQATVKIISVNPNSQLSLQYHNYRNEFWRVIEGSGQVVIDDQTLEAKVGDNFFIPKLTKHRIQTTEYPMKILEISYGKFDENDIVRLEDKYQRN